MIEATLHDGSSEWPKEEALGELIEFLFASIPIAFALLDREMRYVAFNKRWASEYKLPEGDIIGRSHYEIFPNLGSEWRALHARALAGETLSRDMDRFERPDGSVDWIRWSMAPRRNKRGKIVGLVLVSEVITLRLVEKLRGRILDEELSYFVNLSDGFALFLLDDEGKVTIWNRGAELLFGWKAGEVVGTHFDFMFRDEDRKEGAPAQLLETVRDGGKFRERSVRRKQDGSTFTAEITVVRIAEERDLPRGFGQYVRELTNEEIDREAAQAGEELLKSILETMPEGMIVIDEHGTILYFGKSAEEMFGYASDEVVGRSLTMLMPQAENHSPHPDAGSDPPLGQAERPLAINRRGIGIRKDGSRFNHQLRMSQAFGGGRRMFTGFLVDLTEREKAEAKLRELQADLTHIARISEMGTLAAAIAHELNQPLMAIGNIVQTSAELLKSGDRRVMPKVADALEQAGNEAMRAGEIIKRLRSFVSRGELERTVEDPGIITQEACQLAAADAKYRQINCSVEIGKGLHKVLVDKVEIQQVILNLVRNAIQAIDRKGKVRVSVTAEGPAIRFAVADNGPGVPQEQQARLFEPFSTTKSDGMGMGLAICRTIVEAHGGRLWYEPGDGCGAVFQFTLPMLETENAYAD